MKILTLDFEGSLINGVREIGGILTKESDFLKVYNFNNVKELEVKNYLLEILSNDIDFIIGHNISFEKNLLKKYLPYPVKKNLFKRLEWGPWLDTKKMYATLYPSLKKYDLKNLTQLFIDAEIKNLSEKYCDEKNRDFHNALYDALCTYLLYQRLSKDIDIIKFLE
jgi:DNA polymerase III epsilon subunit-like protein